MNNTEFVKKVKDVASNYKTLYVYGCFGAPMTSSNKKRYINHTDYNTQAARTAKINSATTNTFGFDCVGLIKGILWGWTGSKTKTYGGANYASNDVPDINADTMITKCSGVSTNFSKIEVGEALWMKGHIGVYIGDGLAVECTPKWKDGVQITAVHNIGKKSGYNGRKWTKHGKLPYIDYKVVEAPKKTATPTKTVSASESADKFDKKLSGTYVTTANLNMRNDAGATKKSLCVIPKGTKVKCYGYYSLSSGVKWYYVQVTLKGVTYTGFSSSRYLKKA